MYLLVIFLPFISFICAILFGKYLGRRATAFLTIILLFLTTLCAIVIFYEVVLCHSVCTIKLIP